MMAIIKTISIVNILQPLFTQDTYYWASAVFITDFSNVELNSCTKRLPNYSHNCIQLYLQSQINHVAIHHTKKYQQKQKVSATYSCTVYFFLKHISVFHFLLCNHKLLWSGGLVTVQQHIKQQTILVDFLFLKCRWWKLWLSQQPFTATSGKISYFLQLTILVQRYFFT